MTKHIRKLLPWVTATGTVALVAGAVGAQASTGAVDHTRTESTATAPRTVDNSAQYTRIIAAVGASGSSIVAPSVRHRDAQERPAGVAIVKPVHKHAPVARSAYKFEDSDILLRLRASAVQPEADIPRPLVVGIGYSSVYLQKGVGAPDAECKIFGAGFYAGEIIEQGVLENSGPPDAGNKGGGIFNPTQSKDYAPNLSPGENLNARKPQIKDISDGHVIYEIPHNGNGVRWEAKCDNDAGGTATGNNLDLAGLEGAGSTTTGHVSKKTGEYIGQSRAYIGSINTGSGTLDSVASMLQIKHLPGQKPTISYSIGFSGGTLASGVDIPYGSLTEQFNNQMKTIGASVAALGPLGVTLMGPTESFSEDGGRYIINAPFFELMTGLESRKGTVGENNRFRLVNVDYDGNHTGGTFKE